MTQTHERLSPFIIYFTVLCCLLVVAFGFRIPGRSNIYVKQASSTTALTAVPESSSVPRSAAASSAIALSSFAAPLLASLLAVPLAVTAAEEVPAPPAPVDLGPPPTDFGLAFKDFYTDCNQVVRHMRYAVQMEKGNPNLATVAQKTKDEMLDFVSFYRRFNGIAGKQSFSLLYTSINVLAGHYTSYGVKVCHVMDF